MPDCHRVGVHDPCHRLRIGVHVGRCDITIGTDHQKDLGGIAPCEPLQFTLRHCCRVAHDATLSTTVGDVGGSTFPCHERSECLHLVQRDVGVIAYSAFGWSASDVVLNPVAIEDSDRAIVHTDRQRNDELPFHVRHDFTQVKRQFQNVGCRFKTSAHHVEQAASFFHDRVSVGQRSGEMCIRLKKLNRSYRNCLYLFKHSCEQKCFVCPPNTP